jgi:uncharacterized repeat protein (TIGR03806 family)
VSRVAAGALVALLLLPAACSERSTVRLFPPESTPERLSDWGVVTARGNVLALGEGVLPYDLATPLFTDHAHKLRTVWMPAGAQAHFDDTAVFDLPPGTILSKTFFYPRAQVSNLETSAGHDAVLLTEDTRNDFFGGGLDLAAVRLIETRLLVRQATGWVALPYVWDEGRGDAFLRIAGSASKITTVDAEGRSRVIDYLVPTRNECASCHASDHSDGALHPIGIAARHLEKVYHHYDGGPAPQLATWIERGLLDRTSREIRANALWRAGEQAGEGAESIAHRARSYLDINCGHCHSQTGAADTTGLFLDAATDEARRLGVCKPPIAAGRGSGGRSYSIVPGRPDESILVYRLASEDPAVRMPEIGRSTAHEAGVALVRRWIERLPGRCLPAPST